MARIRAIEINHFRGIKKFAWLPSPGLNCLIGPGDSGKSSILDAIALCLGSRRNVQFTDTDFYGLDVSTPIRISVTIGELDDALMGLDTYGLFLRSFDPSQGTIEDEPEKDGETVLTLVLTVESDLEPTWSLFSQTAAGQGVPRVSSLKRGSAKKPPTPVEDAALVFDASRNFPTAIGLLAEIRKQPGVRTYRPEVLRACIKAFQLCGGTVRMTLQEAVTQVREQNRRSSRPLPRLAVGSTLLLKGQEAEVVVILNAGGLNARNLYVAMTRGSKTVVICSRDPVLTPYSA